jgi:GLPGLI family protein
MPKEIIFIAILLLSGFKGRSQFQFPDSGRIIFERKVNTRAILPLFISEANEAVKPEVISYVENYMMNSSQFWVDSFQLRFNANETLYEPLNPQSVFFKETLVSYFSKVHVDLTHKIVHSEKHVFNESFHVKDSLNRIKWKLTDETREISGYECRRANGLIFDSVYVVAFYTDAIKTKGGPEVFNGLPGMILGVALPHYHISYFATNVDTFSATLSFSISSNNSVTPMEFNSIINNYLIELGRLNSWTKLFIRL